jgi:hypothetical protein
MLTKLFQMPSSQLSSNGEGVNHRGEAGQESGNRNESSV